MTEIDVAVSLGGAKAVPVLDTTTGGRIASGKCALAGWSLRTTSVQASLQVQGNVAAPAAGTVIATLALPAGEWVINWTVSVEGTVAVAEDNNFVLQQGVTNLITSINANVVAQPYPQPQITVSIAAGGQNVVVRNIGAGTAASVYTADITASPVGAPAIAEIFSGSNPVAEIALPVGAVDTHWFGSGGIEMPADVTLNVIGGSMRGAVYVRLELSHFPDYPRRDHDSSGLRSARERSRRCRHRGYRLGQGVAA